MASVVQEWVSLLPMMQQTVLLELTRGPDGITKYDPSKFLLRYVRRCILYSALDGKVLVYPYTPGGGSFTGPSYKTNDPSMYTEHEWHDRMQDLVSTYLKGVDAISHHFHLHFMHGVQILGYKHPIEEIRAFWHQVYIRFVHDMHVWPETEEQMDRRLGDTHEGWLERADAATIA